MKKYRHRGLSAHSVKGAFENECTRSTMTLFIRLFKENINKKFRKL